MTELVLHVDGASFGNPGPSGIGFVLFDGEDVVAEHSESIGWGTNNEAEYRALVAGLKQAAEHGVTRLLVRSDSQLLVRQMTGEYKVKKRALKLLNQEAAHIARRFEGVRFEYVPREGNARADELAKLGAEMARGSRPAQGELLE